MAPNDFKQGRMSKVLVALAALAGTAILATPAHAASGKGSAELVLAQHQKGRTLSGQGVNVRAGAPATKAKNIVSLPISAVDPNANATATAEGSLSFKRGKRAVSLTGIRLHLSADTISGNLGGEQVDVFKVAGPATANASSGAVGLVEDVRRVPKGWHEGDAVLAAFASPPSLPGSEYQARFGEVGGSPGPLDLEAEACLVSFLWRAAPGCSLVHDAAEGGLAVCLAEAAIHSASGAMLDVRDDPAELFGEVGGRAVLACAPEALEELQELAGDAGVATRRIGTVGGDTLFGIEVARLRDAWESWSES